MLRTCLLVVVVAGCFPEDATFTPAGDLTAVVSNPDVRVVEELKTTFTLALNGNRPEADVALEIVASVDHVSLPNSRFVFTPEDFQVPQTVTLEGVSDFGSDFRLTSLEITSNAFPTKIVPVLVIEPFLLNVNDIDPCSGQPFTVKLDGDPLRPVTVVVTAISGSPSINPQMLVFNSQADTRTVTVTGPVGTVLSFSIPAIPEVEPYVTECL